MMVPQPPAPSVQKQEVQSLFACESENVSQAAVGDEWYIISLPWFNAWKEHVDWDDTGREGAPAPGPIDNSNLVVGGQGQRLKNPAGLESEFEVVSGHLHKKLVEWYSMAPGSPLLERKVIFDGGANLVEISTPVFDLFEMDAESGPAGRRVPGDAQVVISRTENMMGLLLSTLQAWVSAHGGVEPEDDLIASQKARFWFSLGDDEEGNEGVEALGSTSSEAEVEQKEGDSTPAAAAAAADNDNDDDAAIAARRWHPLDWSNEQRTVMELQVGDRNATVVRAPQLLIELRESEVAPWILPSPASESSSEAIDAASDATSAAETTGNGTAAGAQSSTAAAAADQAATEAAKARADARQRALDLDEDAWRASLAVGDELDCFDGKQWRESVVVRVGPPEKKEEEEEDVDGVAAGAAADGGDGSASADASVAVRFRCFGPDHIFETTRGAGASTLASDDDKTAKPAKGDVAKPYTHVSDWRTQLRQDMEIEVLVSQQHMYKCEEADSSLHFVGTHTRFDEWWVSDHVGADSHSRRGYLNVQGSAKRPPTSDEKEWELWVNLPGQTWCETPVVHVTLEGEDVRIHTDLDEVNARHPGFKGNLKKITGLFKRQAAGTWAKRKVVRVDYQKRLVTLRKSSYYSSYYVYSKPQLTVLSLDSDTIREVSFGAGVAHTGDSGDADDIRLKLATTTAGLRNLGNTCFMNSVLQCIFALQPFSGFFADTANVESQINTQNFLGTGGKLARAFTALVRDVATNAGGVVDRSGALPAFKATLGNFAPVFAGFQQQDAMEFFNQFTSLIHEDLNRIKKKPYVEDLDDDGAQSDSWMADESWKRYRMRNDSVVVDLFQGQFRSHLICPRPECGYESRRFDPFSAVACPLPKAVKKPLKKTVRFFALGAISGEDASATGATGGAKQPGEANQKTMPAAATVTLRCPFVGSEVATQLSELSGIPVERLLVVESYQGKIFRVCFDARSKVDVNFVSRDHILVFEIPENFDPKTQVMLEVRFMNSAADETPILLPVPRTEATTCAEIRAAVVEFLKRRMITDPKQLEGEREPPPPIAGDVVTWDGGGEGKTGTVRSVRQGYGNVPTKLSILVENMNGYTVDQLPEDVTHTKDFASEAAEYLRSASASQAEAGGGENEVVDEPFVISFALAETYSYQKSPLTCPWKKPKPTSYDLKVLEDNDKCCPTIACVSVAWKRDLLLLVDPDFDEALKSPPAWEKGVPQKEEKEAEPEVLSLHNSLRSHMRREQLGANDEWYCRGCKQHVRAFKKMDIWRLPPLLVFQLKRFTYEVGQWSTHREKLEGYVDFPFEIDMAHYVIGQGGISNGAVESPGGRSATDAAGAKGGPEATAAATTEAATGGGKESGGSPEGGSSGGSSSGGDGEAPPQPSTKYELVAVSNHMGGLGGGHYTAYAKRGDQWYNCNDSSVHAVKAEAVRTSQAYVLFYRRVETEQVEAAAAAAAAGKQDNLDSEKAEEPNGEAHVESKAAL